MLIISTLRDMPLLLSTAFVIYGGQGDTGLVSLQAKDYTVTVSFTDTCAVGDVQNNQGVSVDNGAWCDGQNSRWLHVPA